MWLEDCHDGLGYHIASMRGGYRAMSNIVDRPSRSELSAAPITELILWDSLHGLDQVCKSTIVFQIISSHREPLPEDCLIRNWDAGQHQQRWSVEAYCRWSPSKPLETCRCHRVAPRGSHLRQLGGPWAAASGMYSVNATWVLWLDGDERYNIVSL